MINLILVGCNGYMGIVVTDSVNNDPEFTITAGIDINTQQKSTYPVFSSPGDIPDAIKADVILDFSSPAVLTGLLDYGIKNKTPIILCATGYTPEQLIEIEKASEKVAIFRSGNMSLGINLLADLIKRACQVLGEEFDVEIVERHHKRKVDAPSGTALMLAGAAADALPYTPEYVYDRESKRKPRSKQEIGISAVRGGTITGVHEVIFAGNDEVIELRHTASSRDIFAAGALKAAKFMKNQKTGSYDMSDVLK